MHAAPAGHYHAHGEATAGQSSDHRQLNKPVDKTEC